MFKKVIYILPLVAAILFVSLTELFAAAGTIDGCVDSKGVLRISSNGKCLARETPLSWNIQGPVGPQGPKGDPGPTQDLSPLENRVATLEARLGTVEAQLAQLAPSPTPTPTTLPPQPPPIISIGSHSDREANVGMTSYIFPVSLSGASSEIVTVDYAPGDNSATVADNDYAGAAGTLTFLPGEIQKTITMYVVGDTKPEDDETFSVLLSNPTNAAISTDTKMVTGYSLCHAPQNYQVNGNQGLGEIVDDDSCTLP